MSGIGEFAYTLLLGWMRALVDWLWSLASGGGGSGFLQWFLSNWKVWLLALVLGGLVADWVMWMVRWRPYRLLFGRLRHVPAGDAPPEAWDSGVGYYEHEMAADTDPVEWADMTSTLSEIDPDWAGGVVIENEPAPAPTAPESNYYSEAYEEPPEIFAAAEANDGYWDETPDEQEAPNIDAEFKPELSLNGAQEAVSPYAPPVQSPYDPYPGDEETAVWAPEPPVSAPFEDGVEGDGTAPPETPARAPDAREQTSPQYGRPGLWPGMRFPFQRKAKEPAAAATPYPEDETEEAYPLGETLSPVDEAESAYPADIAREGFPPEPPEDFSRALPAENMHDFPTAQSEPSARRRRRRLHESANDAWQPEDPLPEKRTPESRTSGRYAAVSDGPSAPPPFDPWADTRPSRVVQPAKDPVPRPGKREEPLRTVTGKPAKRRGLMRFTSSEEEPIAGLPPMDLTDPFLPAVRPSSPDFEPDDGEEFDTKGK